MTWFWSSEAKDPSRLLRNTRPNASHRIPSVLLYCSLNSLFQGKTLHSWRESQLCCQFCSMGGAGRSAARGTEAENKGALREGRPSLGHLCTEHACLVCLQAKPHNCEQRRSHDFLSSLLGLISSLHRRKHRGESGDQGHRALTTGHCFFGETCPDC